MHRYKNVAITGRKQAGKSTLARWLLGQWSCSLAGFRTAPWGRTTVGPLYALEELGTGVREPISRWTAEGIRGIPECFEGFGQDVVHRAVASGAEVLLLDEIGRFERNSPTFLQAVVLALDSRKTVVAVLKQEPLPHLQAIRDRADTLVIDLDRISREEARERLSRWGNARGFF